MLPVDHIGVAVHDSGFIEELLIKLVNASFALPEDLRQQGIRVRFYGEGTRMEILESLSPDSAVARFLSKRGEGLHHIAFRVANAQGQLDRMRAAGFQPLTEEPVQGASGKRIFFLHPKQTGGVLVEFCQPEHQYTVQFQSCPELETAMKQTGYCIACNEPTDHIVTSNCVATSDGDADHGQSLVVHNASFKLSQMPPPPPAVPILISEVSAESHHALALQAQWPGSELVILPENTQLQSLPAVLLRFWSSLEHG